MNFGEYCEFMDYDPMDPNSWDMYMIDYDDWAMWEWFWSDDAEE